MEAATLKSEIQNLVGEAPADCWITKKVIQKILRYTGEVSSDDVRFYVKAFRPSTKVIGMAFNQLIEAGEIREKGSKKTEIKEGKGRKIPIYEINQ